METNGVGLPEIAHVEHINSLLVLGRGIEIDGQLSKTSADRSEMAIWIARKAMPAVVIFSGARSWRQVLDGVEPPSEGAAMLKHAEEFMSNQPLQNIELGCEEEATSTVANMVYSKKQLKLPEKAPVLGILSDELHFRYGRVQMLARLVFPNTKVVSLPLPREVTSKEDEEEKNIARATRVFMTGVNPGDDRAIMSHQHHLERTNSIVRRLIGSMKHTQ